MPEHLVHVSDGSPPPPPVECRVSTRLVMELPVACQPTATWGRKDSRWPASITDLSTGGVCITVRRRYEPGSGLGIELPGREGEEPYFVLAKVVHVRALPDGAWALGCKFISELDEDEIQHLLSLQGTPPPAPQPTEPSPPPFNPSKAMKAAAPSKGVAVSSEQKILNKVALQLELPNGKVVNCRFRHLAAPEAWPPVADQTLTIRINGPHNARPVLKLEVIRCILQGERWSLRCRLLEPSWEVLRRVIGAPTS